jgi:mannosyltransferase
MLTFGVVALITIVGTLFRFHLLGTKSLWLDEAMSVSFVRLPGSSFWTLLSGREGNMAFYYVLLRGWFHLGDSEFAVRSLSVLFGIATLPAIYLLGSRFVNRTAGIMAAALLAAHSFHVRYSQEARSYSLLLLLLVLSTYFFLLLVQAPHNKQYWLAYIVFTVLAVYAHVFAILVIASQWLSLRLPTLRNIGLRRLVSTATLLTLLISPMIVFVFFDDRGQLDWIPRPTIKIFLDTLRNLTGNFLLGHSNELERDGLLILYAVCFAFGVLGLIFFDRSQNASYGQRLFIRVMSLWFLFPIAATLCISVLKPLFIARYMIICVPAVVLLASYGIDAMSHIRVRGHWFAAGTFIFIVAFSLWATQRYYGSRFWDSQWDSISKDILTAQQANDAIMFVILAREPYEYEYYTHREVEQQGIKVSPRVILPPQLDVTTYGLQNAKENVEQLTRGVTRLWLVWDKQGMDGLAPALLPDSFKVVSEQHYSDVGQAQLDVTIALYSTTGVATHKVPLGNDSR